jgi:23S rRNA (cytosine1962-C5)-methyltransferase
MATVVLKKGKEKAIQNHHPWIFSGAIAGVEGEPADGDTVDVVDATHNFLARGYFNSQSQITVRLLTWNEEEAVDHAFWKRRIV